MSNVSPAPTVTVLILTRNTCELTCAAVRSVTELRDSLTKETVVVDNGSTDGTAERLQREFPGIKIIRRETNLGFARAVNAGARANAGAFLLLLNSDARLEPEALKEAVAWMEAHSECGIVGGQLLDPDGSPQNSIANFPSLATELLNKSLLRRLFPRRFPGKEHALQVATEVETVIGAFMLVRRTVWDLLGGLDERFFFFFEETDFCLRARRSGWTTCQVPAAKVWHEQGASAGQVRGAARVEYWRSRYAYFRKHRAVPARVVLRVGLGVRLLADLFASGMMVMATLGRSGRWRNKWRVNCHLARWHLRGCPEGMGLPR
jgi:GT2 family glycosyltransferase